MDLCIYFLVSADLHRSRLSESFLALSKIPVEKALSELHVLTLSSNDDSPGNTNGNGIHILLLLAGTLRTGFLFLHTYGDGLYIVFHVVHALYDRRNHDCPSEGMDDRPSARLADGKSPRTFGSRTTERTSQPRTPFQDIASLRRTDFERTGKSIENVDEIKSVTPLPTI